MSKNICNDYTLASSKTTSSESSKYSWVTPQLERLPVSATKIGTVSTSFEGGMTGGGQVYNDSNPS